MRLTRLLVPLAGASLVVAGCSQGPGSAASHQDRQYATNGTFTEAIATDIGKFNPYNNATLFGLGYLAYDSLVTQQPDGKFVSELAQKWSVDASSATFTLRPDVTCSDGERLTASQVAADLTFLGNPKNASPTYGVTVPTIPFTATGDDATRTVTIKMSTPFGFLLNTLGEVPIMCSKGLKNPDILATTSDGTGPFVLTGVVSGQSYTFTVRKGYTWGPNGASTSAPGTPAKVVLRIVSSAATQTNLMLAGEINLATVDGADEQRLTAARLDTLERGASGPWLWFNQRGTRVTADKNVREALAKALDLDQAIKVSTANSRESGAATGLIESTPKPCPGDTVAGTLPKHDVSGANALLDQAGWATGSDGIRTKNGRPLTLDLHYPTAGSATYQATAEFIASQWKSIGVNVHLAGDDAASLVSIFSTTSNFDVYEYGFGLTLPTQMISYASGAVPPSGQNFAGFDNKVYNDSVAKAETLPVPAACQYWNQAERALWTDLDILPISRVPSLTFLKNATATSAGWIEPIPTSIRVLG